MIPNNSDLEQRVKKIEDLLDRISLVLEKHQYRFNGGIPLKVSKGKLYG